MLVEERIRELAEDIIACQDDGQTTVSTEELQDAIRQRVFHLRTKIGYDDPQTEPKK